MQVTIRFRFGRDTSEGWGEVCHSDKSDKHPMENVRLPLNMRRIKRQREWISSDGEGYISLYGKCVEKRRGQEMQYMFKRHIQKAVRC